MDKLLCFTRGSPASLILMDLRMIKLVECSKFVT